MKLLRNPVVVGILALVAVVVVLYQVFGDKLFRVRRLVASKPATAITASAPERVARRWSARSGRTGCSDRRTATAVRILVRPEKSCAASM